MSKEIYVCGDGIVIVYQYDGKERIVTHSFFKPHNGQMVKVSIDKSISLNNLLCNLKNRFGD